MHVHAGLTADQVVHATDPDGDPLAFSFNAGPSYMTVTTTDPGAGSATGNIHLAPPTYEAGQTLGIVGVYDGTFYRTAPFTISVFPVLQLPRNMTVDEGSTADQRLSGVDMEGFSLTFTMVSGPTFATVTTTSDTTGNIHLAPGFSDSGFHDVSISISDGVSNVRAGILVQVNNINNPPVLTQPQDMHAIVGSISEQGLTAYDADFQPLTFSKVAGPTYVSVVTLSVYPPRGYLHLEPRNPGDLGTAQAAVAVSDGTSSDRKSFMIQVDNDNHEPTLHPEVFELDEGTDLDGQLVVRDADGQRLYASVSNLPRFATSGSPSQAPGADSLVIPMRMLPGYDDVGVYHPTVQYSDGLHFFTDTLSITVHDAYPGETSLRLSRLFDSGDQVDAEYSILDGTFTVSPDEFRFQDTSGSGANWHIRYALPWAEGDYEYTDLAALFVIGSDSTASGLAPCTPGTQRLQIKRVARRLDGTVLSLWATFQLTCGNGSFGGELRYQVQGIPITLSAPHWLPTNTNQHLVFRVAAVDTAKDVISLTVSGLPAGSGFLDFGGGEGSFGWTPSRLQGGRYLVRTIATSAGGLTDTTFTSISVTSNDLPPQAHCGGPYTGTIGIPIPFTSSGTRDPDGDPLTYHWTFGDNAFADVPEPMHAYARTGPYPVSLLVSDGILAGGDVTLVTVYEGDSARAFQAEVAGHSEPLRLLAGAQRYCVGAELLGAPTSIVDIDRFSFRMLAKGLGTADAITADPTTVVLGDTDGNGVNDITACFTQEDLRLLFSKVRGRVRVTATIEVALGDGHGFRASLPVDVIGPDGPFRVLMAPNPLRPAGMLSFVTTVGGSARLTLFDGHGRLVRTLLEETSLPTGYHDIPIDPRGGDRPLSSGVYFYRLETAEGTRTGRLAIIR